jgi:biopolymer transport protein ExbD
LNLRPRIKEDPTIDLTSLIDVVFLLLIFFMVSTTFERPASLKIDLPEASAAQSQAEQVTRLELVIDSQGRMFLNDRQLVDGREQTLKAALIQAVGDDRSMPMILRADRETPHHFVVTAMDVAAQLGFVNLSIAADRSDGSEG